MNKELAVFDELKAAIRVFVSPIKDLSVTDTVSAQQALTAVKTVKGYINQLEDKRKELVKPLNDQVDFINAYAKDIKSQLIAGENHIKRQLLAFEEAQEKIRQEKLRKEEEKRREIERKAQEEESRQIAELEAKQKAEMEAAEANNEHAELFGDPIDVAAERKVIEEKNALERAEKEAELERQAKVRELESKQREWDIQATRLKNTKKAWKCEATDLTKVPREFLIIELNTSAVLAAARGGHTTISGVRVWQESQIAIGSKTSLKTLAEQHIPEDGR